LQLEVEFFSLVINEYRHKPISVHFSKKWCFKKMRGLITFLLAAILFTAILSFNAFQTKTMKTVSFVKEKTIFLERKQFEERAFKNAFKQVFWNAGGSERDEVVKNAAEKLARLEKFVEKNFLEENTSINVWAGVVTREEVALLKKRMVLEKKALKCANCFDLNAIVLDENKKPVFASTAFMEFNFEENTLSVSKNGLFRVPELSYLQLLPGTFGFGASVYYPSQNASSIILLPEGFTEKRRLIDAAR